MNILSNAIDALRDRPDLAQPTITITTHHLSSDWITIHIRDNGPGIPETARDHLFDPFFTTKPVGKGTGMGLSISYKIMTETHGGQLLCHSKPGQGAEFLIKLPTSPACGIAGTTQNKHRKIANLQYSGTIAR